MILPMTWASLDIPLSLKERIALLQIRNLIMCFVRANVDVTASVEREFTELIKSQSDTIAKICFSYASSVAEYDDLRQDAMINIWRGMKSFRHEASLGTWVYRVVINSCLSTIRSQSRHRHDSLDYVNDLIDCDDADKEDIELLHRVIRRLGAQDKAIIMMWLDEYSYDEIALTMGMNRNTVATKIRRIKEKIRIDYLKEENL
ncbi:MAG: sigma-70 family RNA polymerase sigma factor [Muribaculum sp.]|nr:sigma-70 family RNA polymerase sigma factor [Muribaculaceae bacterium]MCM1081751.1 sigma-70 family RNA polymerase sigma factor [Muribaculum sp.]